MGSGIRLPRPSSFRSLELERQCLLRTPLGSCGECGLNPTGRDKDVFRERASSLMGTVLAKKPHCSAQDDGRRGGAFATVQEVDALPITSTALLRPWFGNDPLPNAATPVLECLISRISYFYLPLCAASETPGSVHRRTHE